MTLITDSDLALELVNKFHLAAGVWQVTSERQEDIVLVELNPAAFKHANEEIRQALGHPLLERFPSFRDSEQVMMAIKAWSTGAVQVSKETLCVCDITEKKEWFQVSYIPVSGDRVVLLYEDITEKVQQREQLQRLALQDPLTGALNRRGLTHALDSSFARADRTDTYTALLYFDLDGFKVVNDKHGHKAGDELLQLVTQEIRNSLRGGDTLARLGGDEFAVVCEQVQEEDSSALAAKILDVLDREWQLKNDVTVRVGVSVGIALAAGRDVSPQDFIDQADQAMYDSKRAGGQRCTLAPGSRPTTTLHVVAG